MPAEDYFVGPGIDITRMTILQPGDLLTAIRLPATWGGARFYFEKVRDRQVWDFALVSVASAMVMSEGGNGPTIDRMRIVVNGVAARPLRLQAVEDARARTAAPTRRPLSWPRTAPSKAPSRCSFNAYKVPLMRNLVKRAIRGRGHRMNFLTWGRNPWDQPILTHISWDLLWASLFAGVAFLVAHASYMVFSAHRKRHADETDAMEAAHARPAGVASSGIRWRRACFTGSWRPRCSRCCSRRFCRSRASGFAWVTWHWTAGLVLTASILFHIIHATVWLDFWSIWVGPRDLPELKAEVLREFGHDVPGPRPGKYPLGNRLYHLAIVVAGARRGGERALHDGARADALPDTKPVHLQGQHVGPRVRLARHWRSALVGLVIAHVYFAVRPEKWWITKSMILGWITRRQYLEHHDPDRWAISRSEGSAVQ